MGVSSNAYHYSNSISIGLTLKQNTSNEMKLIVNIRTTSVSDSKTPFFRPFILTVLLTQTRQTVYAHKLSNFIIVSLSFMMIRLHSTVK